MHYDELLERVLATDCTQEIKTKLEAYGDMNKVATNCLGFTIYLKGLTEFPEHIETIPRSKFVKAPLEGDLTVTYLFGWHHVGLIIAPETIISKVGWKGHNFSFGDKKTFTEGLVGLVMYKRLESKRH